jgi:hypothetical protein
MTIKIFSIHERFADLILHKADLIFYSPKTNILVDFRLRFFTSMLVIRTAFDLLKISSVYNWTIFSI